MRGRAADVRLGDAGAAAARGTCPTDDPLRAYADRLAAAALGDQSLRGYLTGSIDVVLRVPAGRPRYLVVDYKTNWLGPTDEPLDRRPTTAPTRSTEAMVPLRLPAAGAALRRRCCTASCAGGCPATTRRTHLGGVLYLYLRGMCGPDTPLVDGAPVRGLRLAAAGRRWSTALSDLLDGRRAEASR